MKNEKGHKTIKSGGNVFEDLGLPHSKERLAKAQLAFQISEAIKNRHLSQTDAAKLLCIDQPKISAIINGRLSGFSLERLIQFLNLLDRDVQIIVSQKPRNHKHAVLEVVFS